MLRKSLFAISMLALAALTPAAVAMEPVMPSPSIETAYDPPTETVESFTMNVIEIICRRPGMRRCGSVHPAVQTYPVGYWSEEQLAVLRADRDFQVSETVQGVTAEPGRSEPLSSGVDQNGAIVGRILISGVGSSAIGLGYEGTELFRRGETDEPDFVLIDPVIQIEVLVDRTGNAVQTGELPMSIAEFSTMLAAGPTASPTDPAQLDGELAVAAGADMADQVVDNGAGPAQPHLDAQPDGTGEAAGAPATNASEALGETTVPGGSAAPGTGSAPAFANERVESIRSAIAGLGDDDRTQSGRPKVAKLEAALGFRPTQSEIDAALVEAVAPELVAKT